MPELPEVEVTRRALAPYVEGSTVTGVEVRERRLRWPVPKPLEQLLIGYRIDRLERRGKYLLWRFAHGTLISHLGMSGTWRVHEQPPAAGKHDHLDIVLSHSHRPITLRLNDPRRFGAVLWHAQSEGELATNPLLAALGIEPFAPEFDGAWLYRGTRKRTAAIKPVLLSGAIVVGVGNIYASESLFRARIHPRTPAWRLSRARCSQLAAAVRNVLGEAIAVGGTTLRDFVNAMGQQGYFMLDASVYERAGLPCRVCARPIRRIVQSQRATYYCAYCQRL